MRFDIKTISEANAREQWYVKHRRKVGQQSTFAMLWRSYRPSVKLPATITFTRFSCSVLDSDNLAGAFKHVRDQLAKEIGVDDGSDKIKFEYRQERIKKRQHYFTVEIV